MNVPLSSCPFSSYAKSLVKRIPNTLRYAAVNLSIENERIDDLAAIVHDEIFLDLNLHRLRIDFNDHGVDAAGGCASFPDRNSWLLPNPAPSRLDRAACRVGFGRQFAQAKWTSAAVLHFHHSIGEFEFIFRRVEMFGGDFENFLAHNLRSFIDGIACHNRSAAGKRARAQ